MPSVCLFKMIDTDNEFPVAMELMHSEIWGLDVVNGNKVHYSGIFYCFWFLFVLFFVFYNMQTLKQIHDSAVPAKNN